MIKLNLMWIILLSDSYKQKQCIDNCIERHLQTLECIQNPFTTESFVLFNSNQISTTVCDKLQNITIDIKHCHKDCPKKCLQNYSQLKIKPFMDNFDGDSYLKIVNENEKKFSYQAESQMSLIKYIADLGGLLGLYLGISLMEMGKFIKYSIKTTKKVLNYISNMKIIKFMKFKKWFRKFNFLLDYLDKINFTLISKLIFNPILIYELISMVNLYFQYSTQTNYEFKSYNISDNKYSINEFPSITVCTEQLFGKIWFEDFYDSDIVTINELKSGLKKVVFDSQIAIQDLCKYSLPYLIYIEQNITNSNVKYSMFNYIYQYFEYYLYKLPLEHYHTNIGYEQHLNMFCNKPGSMLQFIVNNILSNNYSEFGNKMSQFEDKYSHGLSPVKQLFDFYGQHYRCVTNEPSIDCSQLSPALSLLSPSGKCHTFLWNLDSNLNYIKSIDILINIFFVWGKQLFLFPHYLKHRIFIQDKLYLPSTTSLEIIPYFNFKFNTKGLALELKKTVIKRLEKPYDTECHDYGQSNQIDCLNKCFLKKYQEKFNCLPNHNKYHTIVLNTFEDKIFCPNHFSINLTQYETSIQLYCNEICGDPCVQTLFKTNIVVFTNFRLENQLNLFFKDKTYTSIEYLPKITTMEFLINLFNIWNLWHGTSLITVISILTKLSIILTRLFGWSFNLWNKKVLINIIMVSLTLLFAEKILSHTMEYFQFETQTKVILIDYANDDNYPYLSFVFSHSIPYFPLHMIKYKFNFTDSIETIKFLNYDEIKPKIKTYFNGNYSMVDLVEFVLGYYNVSKHDLFDRYLIDKYTMNSISIISDKDLKISFNNYSISYYANWLVKKQMLKINNNFFYS